MTIGNHLVERKELKQVERKGLKGRFKVTHHVKSMDQSNKGISSNCQGWFFGERSILPREGRAAHEWINRAPAWKANMEVVIQEILEILS